MLSTACTSTTSTATALPRWCADGTSRLPDSNVTDGATKDITFVAGINTPDGRGNATVYIGYRELEKLKQDQRDFSACSLGSGSAFSCAGSSTSAPGRFRTRADSPFGAFDSTIGSDNRLRPFTTTDQFNFAPDNYYQRPDERKTAGLFAHYDFSEKASVYTEFMFMDDRTRAQIAASGAFLGGGPGQPPFFGDQVVNCDNPLLTPDELNAWCGGNPAAGDIFLDIGRRNVESGGRLDDLRHTSFRGVVGMRGDIADGWTYDIYGLYGTSMLVRELSERPVAQPHGQGAQRGRRHAPGLADAGSDRLPRKRGR